MEALENRCLLNAGELDVVFGGTGQVTTDFSQGVDQAQAIAVQPDSKLVVVGSHTASGHASFALSRYQLDGSLDSAFGAGGKVVLSLPGIADATAKGVVLEPDGKIVVAGTAGPSGGEELALARFNRNGTLDTTFGAAGTVLTDLGGIATASAVTLDATGGILVGGSFQPSSLLSAPVFAISRFTADGHLDTTFGSGGTAQTDFGGYTAGINKLLLQPDGSIVAVGHSSVSSDNFGFAVARYHADGSPDTSFNGTGRVKTTFGAFDDAFGVARQTDGSLVVAGSTYVNNKTVLALARYRTDGTLDPTFGTGGLVTTDLGGQNQAIKGVTLQSDGKILVCGDFQPSGPSMFLAARYRTDGSLDPAFGPGGWRVEQFSLGADSGANDIAVLPDGTFVVAGAAGSDFGVARSWGDAQPPVYARGSAAAVFINATYQDLLGRPVDSGGLSFWLGAMSQGATRGQIVQGITGSREYRSRQVDRLYATLLGRSADALGQSTFTNALGAGVTLSQLEATFLASDEYFQRTGAEPDGFLSALYHDVLGRSPDAAGLRNWERALASGLTRADVARQFVFSTEATRDCVSALYTDLLGRSPDSGGLAFWAGGFQHDLAQQALVIALIGSEEYRFKL